MLKFHQYIEKLFAHTEALDSDLKQILEKYLCEKYNYKISIKNLKFVETASHTMFFSSEKINSLYNAPLNSIIFSKINLSNVSLSLATSKIKMNNYSSPQYLNFFERKVRLFPISAYKNAYVHCMERIPLERLEQLYEWKELYYAQELINKTDTISNKDNLMDIDTLKKRLSHYTASISPLKKKLSFRNSIYDTQIDALTASSNNKNHKNFADQVNFAQTALINKIYQSDIRHFYLSLEDISSQLFLSKIAKDPFLTEIFCGNISQYLHDSLFLQRNGKQLEEIPNIILKQLKLEEIISFIQKKDWILNVKFSLLLLNIYGLQTFGGRFQKEYMKEFTEEFLQSIKHSNSLYSNILIDKLKKVVFLDFSSMIITKKNGKNFCDYNTLLSEPFKIDDGFMSQIYYKSMREVENNTKDYLETKRK